MEAVLRGITWGHSRGFTPLLAASQRYEELHPGVQINWTKRTLQEFADYPLEKLTDKYDLLIIDHPWVGCAAATGTVLPVNEYLSTEYLDDQLKYTVGESHLSYNYNDQQWALAIDAATPAASYRKDLLDLNQQPLPVTWNELIDFASKGRIAVPAIPIDLLMNFYSFSIVFGNKPFQNEYEVTDRQTGLMVLEAMKELYSLVDRVMFTSNPIAVAELMTTTNDYWYCPFAYCYSNYSRAGYAKNILNYTHPVSINGNRLKTTIGGTGLAVSSSSKQIDIAVDFASWIVSGEVQRTFYMQHGGQPGHRSAWVDEDANRLTNNFFKNVLPVMENGYMRPRYNGYLYFQDHAGTPLQKFLMGESDPKSALEEMNSIYRKSLFHNKSVATV